MKDFKCDSKWMFINWASCNSGLCKSHFCNSHLQMGKNPITVAERSGLKDFHESFVMKVIQCSNIGSSHFF